MSKKKYCCQEKEYDCCEKNTFLGLGNCCCDFPTLIILILIILQFNKKGGGFLPIGDGDGCGHERPVPYFGGHNLIDNSILFIIALFFLSCCNPCRK
jgi:hypothetical protein